MIISRYVTKEIFATFMATTLLLLLIFTSEQLLSYLRGTANGHVPIHAVFILLSLQLPVLLTFLLPLSLFLSILLALGRLYLDNEIAVLFASGVSRAWLLRVAFRFAIGVTILVGGLSLWIAPKMEEYSARILATGDTEAMNLLVPGRFTTIATGKWVFYVEDVAKNSKQLFNVFAAEEPASNGSNDVQNAWGAVFAKSGYLKTDANGEKFLVLTDGSRYRGVPGNKDYQIISFSEYGTSLNTEMKIFPTKEKTLPTKKLWQNRSEPNFAAELNWRISLPLAVIILSMLAVPLSKANPQFGRYAAIIPAILVYVLYANLIFLGRAWLIKHFLPAKFGMWWVHFIMLVVALFLLGQQTGWQRVKSFIKIL